MITPQL